MMVVVHQRSVNDKSDSKPEYGVQYSHSVESLRHHAQKYTLNYLSNCT
jgi:hypothetical protein